MARRDDREYREYLSEEQRCQAGCIAGRMQADLHHGLLGLGFMGSQVQEFTGFKAIIPETITRHM